jgi:hypothetical protein
VTAESETLAALRRAARRVLYHLARAGVEGLKAVEAVVDELAKVGKEEEGDEAAGERRRIEVE